MEEWNGIDYSWQWLLFSIMDGGHCQELHSFFPLGFVAVSGAGPAPVCILPWLKWKELCQSCFLMKGAATHSPVGPYNRQGKKHLWRFSLGRVYVTGSAPASDPPSSHHAIQRALVRLRWHWKCVLRLWALLPAVPIAKEHAACWITRLTAYMHVSWYWWFIYLLLALHDPSTANVVWLQPSPSVGPHVPKSCVGS